MKFLIFIAVIFILYAVIENRFMLFTRTEYFCSNQSKIKIVHLSDLHRRSFGKNNCRLIRKIKSLEPDIIIFSGDLITRDCKSFDNAEKLVQAISKIAPVFFSLGNHELDMRIIYPEKYKQFISVLKKNNIHILDNCIESVTINNRIINIAGVSLKYSVYKKNNSYKNLDKYSADDLISDLKITGTSSINILIAHNPFFAETYSLLNPDYTLCGHVHGGAVRIFGIPLLSPERRLFPNFSKGVFQINNMKLLVSGGLGKLRLFNPPEIPVYYI